MRKLIPLSLQDGEWKPESKADLLQRLIDHHSRRATGKDEVATFHRSQVALLRAKLRSAVATAHEQEAQRLGTLPHYPNHRKRPARPQTDPSKPVFSSHRRARPL